MSRPASLVLVVLAVMAAPPPLLAQSAEADKEERVTLLVPGGAGGGTDALARRLALLLNEPLGMPVVVVNRPQEDGQAAIEALAGAKPDGRTLGLVTGRSLQTLARPESELSPILLFNLDPPAVHLRAGDAPAAALPAVLAGEAQASGGAVGSLWHLALADLARNEGRSLPDGAWRPVGDTNSALRALADGDVRLVLAEPAQGAAGRRAGEFALFETTAGTRSLGGWRGLAGPPGMSKKRREAIARAARLVAGSDEFRSFMQLRGYAPADLGPGAFGAFLQGFARASAQARGALD